MEKIQFNLENYIKFVTEEIDNKIYKPVRGNSYLEVLKALHEYLKPNTYLEIGVAGGRSLALADAERIIGVDPAPNLAENERYKIYPKTSDLFFEEDAPQLFAQQKIDLAFIDGMHLFEFALRDFINIERYSHKEGYVAIHDILPRTFSEASRGRMTVNWTGDVWRLIIALRKYRPDLNIIVLDSAPTGLAVVTNLNPDSNFLRENFEEIFKEIMEVKTLSFLEARDLVMHTFSTQLYLMNLVMKDI